jgi:hypothetical protein
MRAFELSFQIKVDDMFFTSFSKKSCQILAAGSFLLVAAGCGYKAKTPKAAVSEGNSTSGLKVTEGSEIDSKVARDLNLKFIAHKSDGIEQFLKPADGSSNGLPESLQGLWWLENNPAKGSILLTFANSLYNAAEKAFYVGVTSPGNFSFENSEKGVSVFETGQKTKATYKLTFKTPGEFRIQSIINGVPLPSAVTNFTGLLQANGNWLRKSKVALLIDGPDYTMKRVVDKSGLRTVDYADYLKSTGEFSLVVEKD